jgi:hypothetical protein
MGQSLRPPMGLIRPILHGPIPENWAKLLLKRFYAEINGRPWCPFSGNIMLKTQFMFLSIRWNSSFM